MQRVGAEFLDLRAKRIDRARVARGRKLEFHIRTGPVDDANPFRVRGRPLHLAAFGLDQEAIKAAKMWRFRPGMRQGEPVPVIITIELTFTLR